MKYFPLTKKQAKDFFKANPENIVGQKCQPSMCPLANAANVTYNVVDSEINPATYLKDGIGIFEGEYYQLWHWQNDFAILVDEYEPEALTGKQALDILNKI